MVPLQVVFGQRTFRDRIELKPGEFYRRLRSSVELPTTSQPVPADFIQAFRNAAQEAEGVVGVLLGSNLSGTFNAAQSAVRSAGLGTVALVDSTSASLGVGLLALRAAELAESGWEAGRIVEELGRVRARSGMLLTVERYDNLLRSGRISRSKAWLAGMLDVKPILSFDADGKVVPLERVRGREQVEARMVALLDQRLTPRPRSVRFGIAHADAPEVAGRVRNILVDRFHPRDCLVSLATGVLGAHVGPGAWGVFYQVDDATDSV
jgi:DegV family protein with EDD domain